MINESELNKKEMMDLNNKPVQKIFAYRDFHDDVVRIDFEFEDFTLIRVELYEQGLSFQELSWRASQ